MGDTLPLVLNSEFLARIRNNGIILVGNDLDGMVTRLKDGKMYKLMFEDLLRHLPRKQARVLEQKGLEAIAREIPIPFGWFLDTERGYLVLPSAYGEIFEARKGKKPLIEEEIIRVFGEERTVSVEQNLDPDATKPKFMPYCDGYDFVEFIVKAYLAMVHGPDKGLIAKVHKAVRQMHSKEGFKEKLLKDPEKYGITANPSLKDALEKLRERYKLFLMSNSSADYVKRLIEVLDIGHFYSLVIPDAGKPAVFHRGTDQNAVMWRSFHGKRLGVESPGQVFYTGDHLTKDVKDAKFPGGFYTGLRLTRQELLTLQRKLGKYAGIEFEQHPHFLEAVPSGSEMKLDRLSYVSSQTLQRADVVTTNLEKLVPILLQ